MASRKKKPNAKRKRGRTRTYVLRLYITGQTPRSTASVRNITRFCAQHLRGRFDLQVIDIYQQPVLAKEAQIVAAPTLIRKSPLPPRRLVGDFSDETSVCTGLDLQPMNLQEESDRESET